MARPTTQPDAQPTAARLLDAAEQEFGDSGFAGARLADIAARAGIRRPSLLYHYPSKVALYTAVVERTLQDLAHELAAAVGAAQGFEARISTSIGQFSAFLEQRPAVGRILLREVLDGHGPGREIIIEHGAPILSTVEGFLRSTAGDRLPADFPLRAGLMQVVANLLLWSASGVLRGPLWGNDHHSTSLAQATLQLQPKPQP